MRIILGLLLLLLWAIPASAATYYVRTDGNDSNVGTTNSAGGAWLTIGKCASTIVAGDFCRVQTGTYTAGFTEATDGTSGNYITYVADGAVLISGAGITVSGDYVRVIGFEVDRDGAASSSGINITNATGVEVWNCTVRDVAFDSIRTDGGGQTSTCTNCLFIGNVSVNSGNKDFQVRGTGNLVAYNESDAATEDFLYLFGQQNRILNNYSHGIVSGPETHTDFMQSGASGDPLGFGLTLFEANRYDDANDTGNVEHHHGSNVQNNGDVGLDTNNVVRRNIWNHHGSYTYGFSGSQYHFLKIYNETGYKGQIYTGHVTFGYLQFDNSASTDRSFVNNIFVDLWGSSVTTADPYNGANTGHYSDYNLWFDTGGSINYGTAPQAEANSQRNVDPLLTDPADPTRDFSLQSGSPARGTGGPLTLANGGGTGTTVTVDDATYFRGDDPALDQYSGNLVVGDTITVGTDVVTVVSIAGNVLTVTPSITWADNDPVYFGSDTTPDIGALPYRAGGYSLSATYTGSGTITVTPNDASLVRFVVCYEDNVPYAVDNASPYECTDPTGTFTARAYPLYASETLWAEASEAGEPDLTPRRFRFGVIALNTIPLPFN